MFRDVGWRLDARHNYPRLGRILMATGRDASDVAITTSFGAAYLTRFFVESNEVNSTGDTVSVQATLGESPASSRPEANAPTQTNSSQYSPTQTQAGTS